MKKTSKILALIISVIMVLQIPISAAASTSSYSKYTDATYTHNSMFDNIQRLDGVDVSEWQGTNINWSKVKNDGIDYAIIRAGYGRYTSQVDKAFEVNYKNAKANNMPLGTYWYSYATDLDGVKQEAETCLEVIKGKSFDYPVYFDLEEKSQLSLGKTWCTNAVKTFCDIIAKAGYTPGLYMSRSPLTDYIASDVRNSYALWIAEYGSSTCKYSGGSYNMWQYADNGTVDGITGDIDMNFLYQTIDMKLANIKVYNQRYTGSALTPSVTVTLGGKTLVKGTDYTVSYSNNNQAGTATVEITGINDYHGVKSHNFVIYPQAPASITLKSVTDTTASFSWEASKGAIGYQLTLIDETTNKQISKYTTSNSGTVSGLNGGSKYSAKVRAYTTSDGKNYYGYYRGWAEATTNPGNVQNIVAANRGYTAIQVKWQKQPYVDGYKIYSYNVSTSKYTYLGATTGANSTAFTVKNLKAGYRNIICVRAYRNVGDATVLSPTAKSVDTCTRTTTPAVNYVKSGSTKKITANWKAISVGSGYQIQYSKSSNFSSGVKTIYVSGRNYRQKTFSVASKGTYYVRVKSYRTINGTKFFGYNGKAYRVVVK